jgi:hypothetical protein
VVNGEAIVDISLDDKQINTSYYPANSALLKYLLLKVPCDEETT